MSAAGHAGVLEGHVRDLSHGGDAVVETERGIVMARGALPGERVRVQVERRASGVLRGVLVAVLEPSPARIAAPCPLAERCGGCPLMTLAPAAQAEFKRERLQRMLAQHGQSIVPEWIASQAALEYRVRARLAWQRGPRDARIGYRAPGSAALVDIDRCLVLAPALARGYAWLRAGLGGVLQGRGEITLGLGAAQSCVIELASEQAQPPQVYAAAEQLASTPGVAGVALRVGAVQRATRTRTQPVERAAAAVWGDPRQQSVAADGLPLVAPAGAFAQANPGINVQLVARVAALAEPARARVLELYAGYGNLTVALAPLAHELKAVESDAAAAQACRQNLAARGFAQARVVCDDAARGALGRSPLDVVVLDPPRAGAREVLPVLVARGPTRIVYVSCDLASLRRDLGALLAAGYHIDAAVALDMFPQTPHLESIVRLRR